MPQKFERPQPIGHRSLEYGAAIAENCARTLVNKVEKLTDALANDPEANIEAAIKVETKPGDGTKPTSPVTDFDKDINAMIIAAYEGTDVRVLGEEGDSDWPDGQTPALELHADPIDGTNNFIEYLVDLTKWKRVRKGWEKLPEEDRSEFPPRPVSGAMVSLGATSPDSITGENTIQWGAIAAPFIDPDGPILWTAGDGQPAMRTDATGRQFELSSTVDPSLDGWEQIVVMSKNSQKRFGAAILEVASEKGRAVSIETYTGGIASMLAALDPTLFDQLSPGVRGNRIVGGALLTNAENWDTAATAALAYQLEAPFTNLDGNIPAWQRGERGAILANNLALHGILREARLRTR